ncbi:MAG: hypothetical protein QNK22_01435 [Xanthomonadales bacterium]|nr:hypothetical protein [Xanthomonadales bacterium]
MKILTLWAETTVKAPIVLLAIIAILMIGASDVLAYEDYSGCAGCHGSFLADPYNSPKGGPSWPDSLHNVHRGDMLGFDCDACHQADTDDPVLLESSVGGNGLAPISCVGCHGRDQDMGQATLTGIAQRGAGLRQHHTGFATCGGCHADQTGYTPVAENILPNYYANPGTGHPNIPSSACSGENFGGSATGLDNDGNGVYDTADASCLIPVELMIFEIE